MRLRLVVLDAAGTLLELDRPVGETYADLARRVGVELDPAALEKAFHLTFRAAPPLAFGHLEPALRPAVERDWWRSVVRDCVALAGAPADLPFDRLFDLAWEVFGAPGPWRVPDDVRPGLRALRRQGYPLAVLSNWDGRLAGLLDGLGLGGYFARILVSADLPAAKPSPEIFRAAAEALAALGPAKPVMVGDRIDHDIEPARAAGWDAIWLDREGRRSALPEGAERVSSLRALALAPP
ncbi:MAG TPA: HAD-IA family hydrolase [Gemmatimonadota bacterium]|nr:HAD-IA family hydrolase [Gemmatimonadota bacterium]